MATNAMMYQIKVTLRGVKPPIWRRLVVPSSFSLADLHDVLQVAMGWTESHLHQFVAEGKFYGPPDFEFEMGWINEERVRLDEVLRIEKDAITYEYDFGDDWEHTIVLEKVLGDAEKHAAPSCIAGARASPPEDCGGAWGYARLLEAISDSSNPEHEEMVEWLDEEFDPEHFDISAINSVLAEMTHRGLATRSRAARRKRSAP